MACVCAVLARTCANKTFWSLIVRMVVTSWRKKQRKWRKSRKLPIDRECSTISMFDCTFYCCCSCCILELNDRGAWTAHNYIDKFEPFWKFDDNVERINEDEVSCEEFIERFEKLYKPVVIENSQVCITLNILHAINANYYNHLICACVADSLEGTWKMDTVTIGKKVSKSKIQMRRR